MRAALAGITALALGVTGAVGASARARHGVKPAVTTFSEHFVDTSRPTAATPAAPASDERVLDTVIAYPTREHRRMPLIVLAHGNDGHPDKFKILIGEWAKAGYVVAAPAFPRTSNLTPGGSQVSDFVNQPADVSFVLDQVLKLAKKKSGSQIAGLVDKKHIGVAGLSLGGATVYGLLYNSCCLEKRFDAAIVMSGLRIGFSAGQDDFHRSVPIMLVHGDADSLYPMSTGTYPLLVAPKWFVTLHGSTHSNPFEDSVDPADELVPVITTAFFDLYLKGKKSAAKRLVKAVDDYPQGDLQRDV